MSFSLNEIFTNGAVFPHSKPIKIYGTGEGEVSVTFNGQTLKALAQNGRWQVEFSKQDCGGPYLLTAESNGETQTRDDIYVGEVILVCGQSNVQFKLHESTEADEFHPSNNKLRLFTIDRPEDGEFFKTADGWVKCDCETVKNWTAIGYQIANEINAQKGIATGVIACYQGASVIQSWMPEAVAKADEFFVLEEALHNDHKDFIKWNKPGFLFENMLSRVMPYSVNRMVYYQGESNGSAAEGEIYDKLLCAFIESVRNGFDDAKLPVTVVQIADYFTSYYPGWKQVQAAQMKAMSLLDNVVTVKSGDICETDNIHPPTKKPLALRIVDSF